MQSSCTQPCLFCAETSACNCTPAKSAKGRRRAASPDRGALARERKLAVAQFVAAIEGRLERAEQDVCFSLEDWEKIQNILLPSRFPEPGGRVRVPQEKWELACDLLLTVEKQKIDGCRERGVAVNPKYGPDRYILHKEFDFGEYQKLLRIVLPEMFTARHRPAEPTTLDPNSDFQRALKVFVMADRWEAGEALHHPDDPSVCGGDEILADGEAYSPSTGEVVANTYLGKAAAEAARPKGRLTLEGCCDGPEREYDFQESLKQKPEECGIAARVCRVHAE